MKMNGLRVTLICAAMLALGGCDTPSPKLPHVEAQIVAHPVTYADGVTRLSLQESQSLAEFLNPIRPLSVSRVSLAIDGANPKSLVRARLLRNYLVRKGFDAHTVWLTPSPEIDLHVVVITVEYSKGVPPGPCPDWSKNAAMDYAASDNSNFGCAYQNNLIVQLANPADYGEGHGKPAMDGARESVTMQRYFSGLPAGGTGGASGASGGSTSTTTSSP